MLTAPVKCTGSLSCLNCILSHPSQTLPPPPPPHHHHLPPPPAVLPSYHLKLWLLLIFLSEECKADVKAHFSWPPRICISIRPRITHVSKNWISLSFFTPKNLAEIVRKLFRFLTSVLLSNPGFPSNWSAKVSLGSRTSSVPPPDLDQTFVQHFSSQDFWGGAILVCDNVLAEVSLLQLDYDQTLAVAQYKRLYPSITWDILVRAQWRLDDIRHTTLSKHSNHPPPTPEIYRTSCA